MTKRILVVDDHQFVRSKLKQALELDNSYVVYEAGDGIQAIEQADSVEPDLVVMDFSMPRMNGLDASRALKKKRPELPIVLFTTHQNVLGKADAANAGVSATISKSDGLATLLKQVNELLETTH